MIWQQPFISSNNESAWSNMCRKTAVFIVVEMSLLFWDESKFYLHKSDCGIFVWREPQEKLQPDYNK